MVCAQVHSAINISGAGHAFCQRIYGLVDHGEEYAVNDESGAVGHRYRRLAQPLSLQCTHRVKRSIARCFAARDFPSMRGGGLKKCMPITDSARSVAAASWSISSPEVLLARRALVGAARSTGE